VSGLFAVTRGVSPLISRCELTHLLRAPIDYERARAQHAAYEAALRSAGCEILSLPSDPDLPDSVFVEDTAVVLDEVAVLTRPGVASRRPEVAAVAEALRPLRPMVRIEAPGTLEGGDVIVLDRTVYVGLSGRTNREGLDQLRAHVSGHGYAVRPVEVEGCLHLKSAVTPVGPETLLLNPGWVDPDDFASYRRIEVDPLEPYAANALRVGPIVICPGSFPRTEHRLKRHGIAVTQVEVSEMQKAEGGVTCCSLVFPRRATTPGALDSGTFPEGT
jgi:dimethylargininase